jgi:tRNA1Val (adenine37-N6)-methyltransferase
LAKNSIFKFKDFEVHQADTVFKIGTDAMLLGAFINATNPKYILDIGSGTGVLSLFCAHKFPTAKIVGVDVNPNAAALCNFNFELNKVDQRTNAITHDITAYFSTSKFDLIVSNPPYFENSTKNDDDHLVLARHQDSLPLKDLLASVARLISDTGTCYLILPVQFDDKIVQLLAHFQFYLRQKISIHSLPEQPWRIIYGFSLQECSQIIEQPITVRTSDGSYHESYKKVCGKFHDREI